MQTTYQNDTENASPTSQNVTNRDAQFLDRTLTPIIDKMDRLLDLFGDHDPEVSGPIFQAQDALKRAVLQDECGASYVPPEWTEECLNWQPQAMPPYVATAIEGELRSISISPGTAKGVLANAAYQIARWGASGYINPRDGKRTIWRVAKAAGVIDVLGRDKAKAIISKSWSQGNQKPRLPPERAA